MLEILILFNLTKKNTATATEKGRPGILFGFLTVALWIFCELMVVILGTLFLDVDLYVVAILGLLGGITGGAISYAITKLLPAKANVYTASTFTPSAVQPQRVSKEPETDYCRACGSTVTLPARFCDTCGAKIGSEI